MPCKTNSTIYMGQTLAYSSFICTLSSVVYSCMRINPLAHMQTYVRDAVWFDFCFLCMSWVVVYYPNNQLYVRDSTRASLINDRILPCLSYSNYGAAISTQVSNTYLTHPISGTNPPSCTCLSLTAGRIRSEFTTNQVHVTRLEPLICMPASIQICIRRTGSWGLTYFSVDRVAISHHTC
jgi:hypothetical protein